MSTERRWRYQEPGDDGEPTLVTVTEGEIRRLYYPYWKKQMRKVGKQDQISFENCIEDWIVVHWAEEETPILARNDRRN